MFCIFPGSRREKQYNFEQVLIILFVVLYYKIILRISEIHALNSYITTSMNHDYFFSQWRSSCETPLSKNWELRQKMI